MNHRDDMIAFTSFVFCTCWHVSSLSFSYKDIVLYCDFNDRNTWFYFSFYNSRRFLIFYFCSLVLSYFFLILFYFLNEKQCFMF